MSGYAELHALSNFSFLRGASHPAELIKTAQAQGYAALALCDECSMAGTVRAYAAWQELSRESGNTERTKLIVGSEFHGPDSLQLVLLCADRAAYSELCALITRARRRAVKGSYRVERADFEAGVAHCLALWVPPRRVATTLAHAGLLHTQAAWVQQHFAGRAWLAVELHHEADDGAWLQRCQELGAQHALPVVAAGDVHMHTRERRSLQDALTAIRHGCSVGTAGWRLFPNGERHLRELVQLQQLYPAQLLAETLAVAERCQFSFAELRYEYPAELVPEGATATSHLRALTETGLGKRWPAGAPLAVRAQVERELELIAELRYENFFLTVHDLVVFANKEGILCQGRGSAANSAVCYALGITEVDPERGNLLFERFISRERKEPPDIDVDFENGRREEVIQHIYRKYGRERAALAATVISYRKRSALRDLGKALDLDPQGIDAMAEAPLDWSTPPALLASLRSAAPHVEPRAVHRLMSLLVQLVSFPRHLSQHVGGFVISGEPLHTLVPIENAAMPDRTVIQWDKDDLETLGLLKVDVLALGMLTALRRTFELLAKHGGGPTRMQDIPAEDSATYDMICRGETIGVFQIESRAQMSMLPRLQPRSYYDLVIEVAIVRPGPIQGGMVHPYLKRRQNRDAVDYPSSALRQVLERTLGVPIFQEQVMKIAIVAADFTPGEADALRRSMAAWKKKGGLEPFRERLLSGMRKNGYTDDFAERIYQQILGFGDYGFPESHAASFALLTYVSCWLKCHRPAAFFAALLNSQPMGFYHPAQLLQEARRAGVPVLAPDVLISEVDSTLEPVAQTLALRIGLGQIRGLQDAVAARIVQSCRAQSAPRSVDELAVRAALTRRDLQRLAVAGALRQLAGHRHAATWAALGVETLPGMLAEHAAPEAQPALRAPNEAQEILADYRQLGFSTGRHPIQLLRPKLRRHGILSAAELKLQPDDSRVRIGGIVTHLQQPGTAAGVTFMSLEDETGIVNTILWSTVFDQFRAETLHASVLIVSGTLQNRDGVQHVVARRLHDRSEWLRGFERRSRDFR